MLELSKGPVEPKLYIIIIVTTANWWLKDAQGMSFTEVKASSNSTGVAGPSTHSCHRHSRHSGCGATALSTGARRLGAANSRGWIQLLTWCNMLWGSTALRNNGGWRLSARERGRGRERERDRQKKTNVLKCADCEGILLPSVYRPLCAAL